MSTSLKDALLAPQTAAFMGGVCRLARTQTITVEERFKQSKHNRMACAGNTMHASTAASNHCLSEIRSLYNSKKAIIYKKKVAAYREQAAGGVAVGALPVSRRQFQDQLDAFCERSCHCDPVVAWRVAQGL